MKYTIRELEAFSVIGQEVELTNYHKRNIQISTQFWRKFNADLKKSYLSQFENWIKYAFMIKRNGKLFYFCSIPKRNVIPDGFIYKDIQSYKYLAVEHIGSMDNLYETYRKIYQEIFCTLKDTIIVFIGIEKIQSLKYGYQLRVSEIQVYIAVNVFYSGKGDD
mgnify:CR=1 FL=1